MIDAAEKSVAQRKSNGEQYAGLGDDNCKAKAVILFRCLIASFKTKTRSVIQMRLLTFKMQTISRWPVSSGRGSSAQRSPPHESEEAEHQSSRESAALIDKRRNSSPKDLPIFYETNRCPDISISSLPSPTSLRDAKGIVTEAKCRQRLSLRRFRG